MQTKGYAKVRHWEHGDTRYSSLVFPGLPIPLEPTVAYGAGHLFVGATPQAAMGAIHQASQGGRGLLDNPNFRAQFGDQFEGLQSVLFYDTPRSLRDGYGVMSLACSALVNGTRSPRDATRDAGLVLPPYHELVDGALAYVSFANIVGDDYIQTEYGDRSMLVNLTSLAGMLSSTPAVLGMSGLGAALVAQRQEQQIREMLAPSSPEPVPHDSYEGEHDAGDDHEGHDH